MDKEFGGVEIGMASVVFSEVCHLFIFTVFIIGADCSLFTLLFSFSPYFPVRCLDSEMKFSLFLTTLILKLLKKKKS